MHMADEDEGVVAIFQPDQYLATDSDVTTFSYTLHHSGGTSADSLTVTNTTTVNDNYQLACIGPAQVAQMYGANWEDDWTKIEIVMKTNLNAVKSKKLIIYRDCRPIKHDPVQLTWNTALGLLWPTVATSRR